MVYGAAFGGHANRTLLTGLLLLVLTSGGPSTLLYLSIYRSCQLAGQLLSRFPLVVTNGLGKKAASGRDRQGQAKARDVAEVKPVDDGWSGVRVGPGWSVGHARVWDEIERPRGRSQAEGAGDWVAEEKSEAFKAG